MYVHMSMFLTSSFVHHTPLPCGTFWYDYKCYSCVFWHKDDDFRFKFMMILL